MNLQTYITPHGRIACRVAEQGADSAVAISDELQQTIRSAFGNSSAEGLLVLAGPSVRDSLSADILFWREFARRFFQVLCQLDQEQLEQFSKQRPDTDDDAGKAMMDVAAPPDDLTLALMVSEAPPMHGLEYLTPAVLRSLWKELAQLVRERGAVHEGKLIGFLRDVNPWWHLLGRVTFHLAENKRDPERPFAFLATYTHRLSARARVQHLPLADALKQYASERDQAKLAELLAPVRAAAESSPLVKELIASRSLFQAQAWTIEQAYRFLRDVPAFEQNGLVVRVPNWWKARTPPRPSIQVRLGQKRSSAIGIEGLLDFSVELTLDGQSLTDEERQKLLAASDGLLFLRGKWIEVNRTQLREALDHWEKLEQANEHGIGFLQGMRLLAGMQLDADSSDQLVTADWSVVTAGDWLRETLRQIRDPRGVTGCSPGAGLKATLRPYQADGVRWLWFMTRLGLGACLADDMGLGKTIQVIDLMLRRVEPRSDSPRPPCLMVVPASLVGNWRQELTRFAPELRVFYAHRSESDGKSLDTVAADPQAQLQHFDAVVTTYTLARKAQWLGSMDWGLVVLDEAQAIKNASSAQAKAVKRLKASARVILTGTPVENQLGDLWSLFDFCCPGLLGSAKQFKDFVKRLDKKQNTRAYGALRRLVQPYVLRRLKTDPAIVPDLPEKTEMRVECGLSKKQAVLYEQHISELARLLKQTEGIQRHGLVLSSLMRLKQVCNHPSQYLGQADFLPDDSGKFLRLAAICEPIDARQEKVLVFTQFQSICDPLSNYLESVFGRPGVVLHGNVEVGKRQQLVRKFQQDDRIPFFVISVKAGGVGLNLTAATHVVHFDRWWNPAVENQATDRAFRIGQQRNVLVHKFVCRGTLEERIDQMLRDKQDLADHVLGKGAELPLTEMNDDDLLQFISLDITRASLED
jgi:non-specific serine/threonine protein kinase